MNEIARLRDKQKTLRAEFNARKHQEWTEVQASVQTALEDAVGQAYDSGARVSDLARAYGTSNRGTIYELIEKYRARQPDEDTYAPVVVPLEPYAYGDTEWEQVQVDDTRFALDPDLNVWTKVSEGSVDVYTGQGRG